MNVAFHEAGHVLQTIASKGLYFTDAWINPERGSGKSNYTLNRVNFSIYEELKVAVAGIAADRIYFGRDDLKSGALSDLMAAYQLAEYMVKNKGIEGVLPPKFSLLGAWKALAGYSLEEMQSIFDRRNEITEAATQECVCFLQQNASAHHEIAKALVDRRVVHVQDFQHIAQSLVIDLDTLQP